MAWEVVKIILNVSVNNFDEHQIESKLKSGKNGLGGINLNVSVNNFDEHQNESRLKSGKNRVGRPQKLT